jgi:glycosyltransferase involved in cell wall biosynthesis
MRMAMISGDGLPVSGLLTIFRNVLDLARRMDVVDLPVTADLGYSWRPDKAAFYPAGDGLAGYPDWMHVASAAPVADRSGVAAEWLSLRASVADADRLGDGERAALHRHIETLAGPYEDYFAAWFDRQDVDWVVAMNMTLSDATPVTLALHRAADRRWGSGRPGGVMFWDHDLFASYAVHEGAERVYPTAPNEFTPVPQDVPYHRWVVPTEALAAECAAYPTGARPVVVPYVLPTVEPAGLTATHREFLAQRGIAPGTPVVVAPVRVFRVKGVEISARLLAAVRRESARRDVPAPHLLVFGTLDEDPEYSKDVLAVLDREPGNAVQFLGGVPLHTHRDADGRWHLDEIDLLRIAAATGGGLFYTPNRSDVESVGLGPALAAVAGVPFAATEYNALHGAYHDGLDYVHVERGAPMDTAAAAFVDRLVDRGPSAASEPDRVTHNRGVVARSFPEEPCRRLLRQMEQDARRVASAPVR